MVKKDDKGRFIKEHGLGHNKDYRLWAFIKGKCLNKTHIKYKDYGGRGITMFEDWISDPLKFSIYINQLDNYNTKDFTLDRINNDGNYEPGNLRWASKHTQQTNKRISKNNKTGYSGTCFFDNYYLSYIYINNKCITLGRKFLTLKDAVEARNNYIIQNNLTEYKIQPFIS